MSCEPSLNPKSSTVPINQMGLYGRIMCVFSQECPSKEALWWKPPLDPQRCHSKQGLSEPCHCRVVWKHEKYPPRGRREDERWGERERVDVYVCVCVCVRMCVKALTHFSLLHQPLSILQTIGLRPPRGRFSPSGVTAILFSLTSRAKGRSKSLPNWMLTV